MSRHRDASPDDIEVGSLISAVLRRLPRLLVWSGLLGGITYAALGAMAPRYQSQAEMTIAARGSAGVFNDAKTSGSPDTLTIKMDKEAINTHVRALQSPELVGRIADEMNLRDKREFNSALGPLDTFDMVSRLAGFGGPRAGESERDRVLNTLFKQLDVYAAKESRFIGVRVTATEPELAAEIANRIAESYRASLATAATLEVDEQQKVLQGKIDKLLPEVAAAETEAERYRGEINVFKGGSQTGLNEQQLSELTAELTRAKSSRSEVDARIKAAREMAKAGSADAIPEVQKSPLIQNLVQQRVRIERQISELSATLLPGHPRMQQLNADLAGLKKQISGEVSKLVESLEKEAKVAQERELSVKKSLDEIKAGVVSKAPEEVKLRQLEANARAKRTELENLQAQIEANRKRLDARAQPVEAQIISRATAMSVPIFPKKGQNAALVGFATLLLGAFWTITRALFDGARGAGRQQQSARDVSMPDYPEAEQRALDKAAKSLPKPQAKKPLVKAAEQPSSVTQQEAAEHFLAVPAGTSGYRILLTGATDAIAPEAEAISLARTLRETGSHTVVVEWHPGGWGGASAAAGVKPEFGFTDLLAGQASFEEVVHKIPGSKVHFIGSGGTGGDLESFGGDQINLVLDALDEAYNYIIVTGSHSDCRALFEAIEGRFDAGVLVVDAKKGVALKDPAGTFLGFEVEDIDVLRMERSSQSVAVSRLYKTGKLAAG